MIGRFAAGGRERVGCGADVVDLLAEGLGDDDRRVGEALGERVGDGVARGGGELGGGLLPVAAGAGIGPEQPLMIMAMVTARTPPTTGCLVAAVDRLGWVTTEPP